jgi:hypothetical protein
LREGRAEWEPPPEESANTPHSPRGNP